MNKKEEILLSLSYWVSSLDGNIDVTEIEHIISSENIKSFYSEKNFDHCKNLVQNLSKDKDTKLFVKELVEKGDFTKQEKINIINELCSIGFSDGDFDDIEKRYIGYVVSEFGLEKEKIVENFEKDYKNSLNKKSDTISDSILRLNKVQMNLIFDKKEEDIEPIVQQKIQNHIEKKLSIKDFEITISDLKIKKAMQLSSKILIDQRSIEEDVEINYGGVSESRSVSKNSINLFNSNCGGKSPERNDYDFKNIGSTKKFRVDGSNETKTCGKCFGLKNITCSTCIGSGKNRCYSCGGRGDKDCSSCDGGEKRCYNCYGKGTTSSYDIRLERNITKRCTSCSGRGHNPCSNCGRTGRVRCTKCSGTGKLTCSTCRGRGKVRCSRCNAQGSFTHYLKILSDLKLSQNSAFLSDEPDKNFCTKSLGLEEFDYHKLFGKYEFIKLKEHSSELKNLFSKYKFASSQSPKKIRFSLDDCASMSFIITVAGNVYAGGLKSNGELFFDDTILDQLFFNIIKTLDIDNKFSTLNSIKAPLCVQIPEFKETFEKIDQYKILEKITPSEDKKEKKLNQLRKLTKINTNAYSKHLISKISKKNYLISLIICVVSFFGLWLFNPFYTTVILSFFGLTYIVIAIKIHDHINSELEDATKLTKAWVIKFFIWIFFAYGVIGLFESTDATKEFYRNLNLPTYYPFSFEEESINEKKPFVDNKNNKTNKLDNDFYIIAEDIASTEEDAKRMAEILEYEGFENTGYLWIPDYKSLSGAEYYSVFIGPFLTIEECALEVERYRKSNPNAYGLLVSNKSSERVEIRGPGRITRK